VVSTLPEVEEARTDQERRPDQQKPRSGCKYRTLHCFLNFARISSSTSPQGDPTVLGKECSE
jgi:hypothetical protein